MDIPNTRWEAMNFLREHVIDLNLPRQKSLEFLRPCFSSRLV